MRLCPRGDNRNVGGGFVSVKAAPVTRFDGARRGWSASTAHGFAMHEASVVVTARSASCSLERVMSRGAIEIQGWIDAREAPRFFESDTASGGE
jgi:hypothetical protein